MDLSIETISNLFYEQIKRLSVKASKNINNSYRDKFQKSLLAYN